uniref:Putative secreted protein n=1 Tax=Ixodes ricinus TaxID=34613 RepID=A0A6B0UFU6_IXORI
MFTSLFFLVASISMCAGSSLTGTLGANAYVSVLVSLLADDNSVILIRSLSLPPYRSLSIVFLSRGTTTNQTTMAEMTATHTATISAPHQGIKSNLSI